MYAGAEVHPLSPADPKESQRPQAHECLGETLRVLRQVINKYPLLNTLETLTAAGTLISKVKGEPRAGSSIPHPPHAGEPILGLPGAGLPMDGAQNEGADIQAPALCHPLAPVPHPHGCERGLWAPVPLEAEQLQL